MFPSVDCEQLKAAAERLLVEAMSYHRAYQSFCKQQRQPSSAVVWIEDADGRLVVLTRGEYRERILESVDRLASESVTRFD
jgi:L-rhamnose isomerase